LTTLKFLRDHQTVVDDLGALSSDASRWAALDGSTVLVTGANGMLAGALVDGLFALAEGGVRINVVALARSRARAELRLGHLSEHRGFRLLVQDAASPLPADLSLDYVVHAASAATPKAYGLDPVGTMMPNLFGTQLLLEHCRTLGGRMLFVSSSEVYGSSGSSAALAENDFSGLDPMVVRACYAESKRAAETMCTAYCHQYGVHAVVVRPFHTYGPGLRPDDGRVFADVISDAAAGRDIVLHGDGRARRAYCYLSDAVRGFLDLMTRGTPGEAYNLGNPRETASTLELANVAASLCPEQNLAVRFASRPASEAYIASTAVDIVPDVSKLESLGWRAVVGLREGLMRTLRYQRDATSSLSP
jgi:UDP-glucuronate decarboxylase